LLLEKGIGHRSVVLRIGAAFPDNGGNMRCTGGVNETSSGLGETVLDAIEGICNFL